MASRQSAVTGDELQKLVASDAAEVDFFGESLSLSGDTAFIGANGVAAAGKRSAGAVYVFDQMAGLWTEGAKLFASDAAIDNGFGGSVSLSGDTAVVGAPGAGIAGMIDAGAAYVFVRSGGTWVEQAKLVASDATAANYFGRSVSLSGDTVVVGAYWASVAGLDRAGAAYVFVRSGTTWMRSSPMVPNVVRPRACATWQSCARGPRPPARRTRLNRA